MSHYRAHWYTHRRVRNFGDQLTPVLFAKLAGIQLRLVPAAQAQLFGVGSIAHRIPRGFDGIVFGTGFMRAQQRANLATANVVAVRGALSAQQGGLGQPGGTGLLLADPGLLAPQLVEYLPRRRRRTAVVPHYADRELAKRERGRYVDVQWPVERVVAEVAACDRVVTSSLHALILADALGIESRWQPSPAVIGDGHKFRDYASSYGERIRHGQWRLADQEQVRSKAEQLLIAMRQL